MSAPRIKINLHKLQHNARTLVERLALRGIAVTGVTKACLGSPEVARALLRAGVRGLADSRIENIERMRRAGVSAPLTLLRSPMLSQVKRVVAHADVSFNTEFEVVERLSSAAVDAGKSHGVVLMVELGDLREGLLPCDLEQAARATLRLSNVTLEGIGTNLACRSGVVPSRDNMAELSELVDSLEATLGVPLRTVSGGNSANLLWAFDAKRIGRINDLRLGESILLGRQPLTGRPIDGLHTDTITLYGEVIESKLKPSVPRGVAAQSAFGTPVAAHDRGEIRQAILAIGRQDVDPDGLQAPAGIEVLAASSDHLMVDVGKLRAPVGSEIEFELDYSALLRAMSSPYVTKFATRDPAGRSSSASPLDGHGPVGGAAAH